MLLASTRPSAMSADFTSTVLVAAVVFSATFSVSCFTPRTVLAHAPLSAATTIKAQRPVECLLTVFLLITLITPSPTARAVPCRTAEAMRWSHARVATSRDRAVRRQVHTHGLVEGDAAVRI